MKFECVEYLDSSLVIETNSDPPDCRLKNDEISIQSQISTARCLSTYLTNIFLYVVLCVSSVVIFFKNIISDLSAVIEKNKELIAENKKLKSEMNNLETSLSRIYNPDQLRMLKNNLRRPRAWSDETILK